MSTEKKWTRGRRIKRRGERLKLERAEELAKLRARKKLLLDRARKKGKVKRKHKSKALYLPQLPCLPPAPDEEKLKLLDAGDIVSTSPRHSKRLVSIKVDEGTALRLHELAVKWGNSISPTPASVIRTLIAIHEDKLDEAIGEIKFRAIQRVVQREVATRMKTYRRLEWAISKLPADMKLP